jgi:transcriptional regulator with XRE-family HTH domain
VGERIPNMGENIKTSKGDALIGRMIRERRRTINLSLKQLSEEAGISTGFLSQIERGISSPSLQVLKNICHHLKMPITWLFGEDLRNIPDGDVVVRLPSRRRLSFDHIGLEKELLTHDGDARIQLVMMKLLAGGVSGEAPFVHEGEMAGLVLVGQVELRFSDRVIRLSAGDSFRFAGDKPHSWHNVEPTAAEVLIAVTPPYY